MVVKDGEISPRLFPSSPIIYHRPTPGAVQVGKSVPRVGVLQWEGGWWVRRAVADGRRLLSSGSRSAQVTGLVSLPHCRRKVLVMENLNTLLHFQKRTVNFHHLFE